jgi:dihydroflavonol-4-reductase
MTDRSDVGGRVLVTGGSGFVGRAILVRLLDQPRPVRALVRSDEAARALAALGAEPVAGDVLDPAALAPAVEGCEVVYHAAGVNAFCLRDPSILFRVNVDGALNVLRAAAAAGVRRLVHTSSAAAVGERRGTVGSETSPHRGHFLSAYERSKYEAEQALLAAAPGAGVELVCVSPASVQGPGRTRGTARLLLDHLNGRLPAVVDSRFSVVDVDDCTEGHLLAETHGRSGERYLLSGASLTVREALRVLDEITGVERRPRFLRPALALAAGTAAETLGRVRRRTPSFCREQVRTMLHGHVYDGSRAAREFGLVYTPIEETIRRTVGWYVEQGLVMSSRTVES